MDLSFIVFFNKWKVLYDALTLCCVKNNDIVCNG